MSLCLIMFLSVFAPQSPRLVGLNIEENFLDHELYFGPQI